MQIYRPKRQGGEVIVITCNGIDRFFNAVCFIYVYSPALNRFNSYTAL